MELIEHKQLPPFEYITEGMYEPFCMLLVSWIRELAMWNKKKTNLYWLVDTESGSSYSNALYEYFAYAMAERDGCLDEDGELSEGDYEFYLLYISERLDFFYPAFVKDVEMLLDDLDIMYLNEEHEDRITASSMRNSALQSIW